MSEKTLRDLFIDELHDMYDAEKRLTKALPKLAKSASSKELATAFESHLKQTEQHVTRLEKVMEAVGETAKRKTCMAMVGLLKEGEELMEAEFPPRVHDAALIAAAQKVEHYEMATYGCLRTWAEVLEEVPASKLLQKTLDEEAQANQKLTEIAKTINGAAIEDEDGEDELMLLAADRANGRSRASKARSR